MLKVEKLPYNHYFLQCFDTDGWAATLALYHLANTIEPFGHSSYVKLLWPLVIFGDAHLDCRTDSRTLRAKYCIVGIPHNTAM